MTAWKLLKNAPFLFATLICVSFLCFEFHWLSFNNIQDWILWAKEAAGRKLPGIGVGFDLTASYGTAALSFPNGTTTSIIKIEGAPNYHEVLARLSLESSTHLSPPYNDWGEEIEDRPRQQERQRRKAEGLPASSDVAALSNMTMHLRTAVETHLGHSITHALVSTPNLIALYDEDIQDTFDYLGLKCASANMRVRSLWETITAYAGNGLGLCSNYMNITACREELENMLDEEVVAVMLTQTALTVSQSKVRSAYNLWEPPYRRIVDFSLGLDSRNENPNEEYYWEAMKDRITEILIKNRYSPRPSQVLLFGEASENENFRAILQTSLASMMEAIPPILDKHSVFAPAIGAAEFAKRALWNEAHGRVGNTQIGESASRVQSREGL